VFYRSSPKNTPVRIPLSELFVAVSVQPGCGYPQLVAHVKGGGTLRDFQLRHKEHHGVDPKRAAKTGKKDPAFVEVHYGQVISRVCRRDHRQSVRWRCCGTPRPEGQRDHERCAIRVAAAVSLVGQKTVTMTLPPGAHEGDRPVLGWDLVGALPAAIGASRC
jgi:hypothetical protein